MVNEVEIRAAVAENPIACQPFYRGKRLACVVMHLPRAKAVLVEELLTDAWALKAPKSLLDQLPEG